MACGGLGLVVLMERMSGSASAGSCRRRSPRSSWITCTRGSWTAARPWTTASGTPVRRRRVALAAVRRWGRPAADLERAVAMAHRVETERLRRNVGTLRRVAALSALLGVLGTLFALGRALESIPPSARPGGRSVAWGPALAAAITPLSTGLIIATLALVAYDGVPSRVEKLAGALDRLGAETIEAIALAAPPAATPIAVARPPHLSRVRNRRRESLPRYAMTRPGSSPEPSQSNRFRRIDSPNCEGIERTTAQEVPQLPQSALRNPQSDLRCLPRESAGR